MNETGERMLDRDKQPDAEAISKWIGANNFKRWTDIAQFIDSCYPGVFSPDWIYGGKKHGWGLRYKKSKSFCTLIPEKNRLNVLIVFGAEERVKAESILSELSPDVQEGYSRATTYHDGKWVKIIVSSNRVLSDVKRLLEIKRKPVQISARL